MKLRNATSKRVDKWADNYVKECGRWLRTYMHEQGVTTTELAEATGLSQAQISRLACGLQGFRSKTLYKICYALDIEPQEIVG